MDNLPFQAYVPDLEVLTSTKVPRQAKLWYENDEINISVNLEGF